MVNKRYLRTGITAGFLFAALCAAQLTRPAHLSVRIYDAGTGKPTPVRVRLQDSHGNRPRTEGAAPVSESAIPIPKQAIAVMWGRQDRAEGYLLQPDGSFYVDGSFDVSLPPGDYTLTISKGTEYLQQTQTIALKAGQSVSRNFRLERWIDMPERGWYSSDDHIHLTRSPKDDPGILRWIAAEDIHVGNILEMGDFWATYFTQYAFGPKGRYQESKYVVSPGQEEPRTQEIGHTISLGASAFVRNTRDYYSFGRLFDRVHELGGLTGFAHQGMSFHGYRGMVLNVLRGKVDFLELCQFCVPGGPLLVDHYYHFLDLGYKLTALAGSDFPWCGKGPDFGLAAQGAEIGNARFYTYVGGEFTFDKWFSAVKAGHTFVTTGPVVFLKVNGQLPGETVDAAPGESVHVTAEAYGQREQEPLRSLEIVGHGKVLKRVEGDGVGRLTVDLDVPVEHGIWIAAKCEAGKAQVAHTTPVYVTVNGGGFFNPATAPHYRELSEKYLEQIEQEIANPSSRSMDYQAARNRAQLERQIAEARGMLKQLAEREK